MKNSILPLFSHPVAVSDGAGGAVVVMSVYGELYAQRKSADGKLMWNTLATPVTLFNGASVNVTDMQQDGKGGAYIAFTNHIAGRLDLYLQRLDSLGNKLFGANGVRVNKDNSPVNHRGKLSVGKTGVTIVWSNTIAGRWDSPDSLIHAQLYIQRFNDAGVPEWPKEMLVSGASGGRFSQAVVSDGEDGTYVIFNDLRNLQKLTNEWGEEYVDHNLYMQYFSAVGKREWGDSGRALAATQAAEFTYQDIYSETIAVPDADGGFSTIYLCKDIAYAQRVNRQGVKRWQDGIQLATDEREKYGIHAIPDGTGGLVASWFIVGPRDPFIYAQRVAGDGSLPWTAMPLVVNSPGDFQMGNPAPPGMVIDETGDYVFAWYNSATDTTDPANPSRLITQLKAQKITHAGSKSWPAGGRLIYQSDLAVFTVPSLVKSTTNRIMAIWGVKIDSNPDERVTSALINPDGSLVHTLPAISETIRNGNWNDPSIWADGKVPAPGADVVVKAAIMVNQNVTCKSMKVIAPGVVTVAAGFNITVTE